MATVTAIYRPFLLRYVIPQSALIGGGAVKTPATEKFPNLHPHGALNPANMVGLSRDWHRLTFHNMIQSDADISFE